MIAKLVISIVIVVIGFLLYASTRANTFRVERSINIKAPPEKIFSFLTNLRNGEQWSPWVEMDPHMAITYSGPEAGVGATQEWSGNKQTGSGRMVIVESVENERVVSSLDFFASFKAHNMAAFLMEANGDGTTKITWAMYGPQPFMAKVMGLIFNCDKMVGPHFERGLSKLRTLAEA
jgi:uncharacterized protein YndB with AHSA1/START domain